MWRVQEGERKKVESDTSKLAAVTRAAYCTSRDRAPMCLARLVSNSTKIGSARGLVEPKIPELGSSSTKKLQLEFHS